MKLKELQDRYRALLKEAEDLRKEHEGKEAWGKEVEEKFDRIMDDADKLQAQIERAQREEKAREWGKGIEDPAVLPSTTDPNAKSALEQAQEVALKSWSKYIKAGYGALGAEGYKALQADNDTGGGFLLMPQRMVSELLQAVDDMVFVRQFARIERLTSAVSLGVPSLDTDLNDADWTAELTAATEDTALAFGGRELKPNPLSKLVKMSNRLIRMTPNAEGVLRDRLAYKFAVTEEKGFLTGSGANQPLGVFTASAQGISTGRDVSTGNSSTAIAADGLIEAKYTLKAQYWPRARWAFHRDAVKSIRKLKAGDGNYLMGPLAVGIPPTILDIPFVVSEFVPNTFTTGLYVGILGDFSFYWIAESLDFSVQRLVELYATTNQTGFIGRQEVDGMPVLEEAFVRVTLA